jgi:hypothetical protein
MGVTRQRSVQGLKAFGRVEKQSRSVGDSSLHHRDLSAQPLQLYDL